MGLLAASPQQLEPPAGQVGCQTVNLTVRAYLRISQSSVIGFAALFRPKECDQMSPREYREAELYRLWSDDPFKLVGIYRHLAGLGEIGRLPEGATIAALIQAILDHEEAGGKLTDDPQKD